MMDYSKETLIEKASKKILSGDKHVVTICNSDGNAYLSFLGRSAQIAYLRGYVECHGKKIELTEKNCPVNVSCYNKRDREWCLVFDKEGKYIMSTEDPNFSCNIIALAIPVKNQRYGTTTAELAPEDIPIAVKCLYDSRLGVKAASVIRDEQIVKIWVAESDLILNLQSDSQKQEYSRGDSVENNQFGEKYHERNFESDFVSERR